MQNKQPYNNERTLYRAYHHLELKQKVIRVQHYLLIKSNGQKNVACYNFKPKPMIISIFPLKRQKPIIILIM